MSIVTKGFDAFADAQALRKAMRGLGTDDDTLIEKITARTNEQLQAIRERYQLDLDRDLIADLKSETSGDYAKAVVGLVYTPSEFDALQLHQAVQGAGTDEAAIIEVLSHRSKSEIEAIKKAYLKMFSRSLEHDIGKDESGLSGKLFLAMCQSEREDTEPSHDQLESTVTRLYDAGQGRLGTDEQAFVDTIVKLGPKYLPKLNAEYGRRYGNTLSNAVSKEMSGTVARGISAMMQDHDEYYADVIHKAMAGLGTDEDMLTRVLVSRRHRLDSIAARYKDKYGKSMAEVVQGEVGGKYGRVLMGLIQGC